MWRARLAAGGLGLTLVCALACRLQATSSSPPPDSEGDTTYEAEHPLEPATPANQAEGDTLELVIPSVEGGGLALGALRGRPVLLTLGEPESAEWDAGVAWYEALLRAHPDDLELILVAATPDPAALDDLIVPWALGWDPQGALAAQLEIAGLPTSFLLDAQGRIVAVVRGLDEAARARVEAELAKLAEG